MAGKFLKVKKLVIPMISLILLVSQLSGCAILESREMLKMINRGESIVLEVAQPSYNVVVKGEQQKIDWIQLDQLKSHQGFRQDFDSLFRINIVSENGINGKNGCLYVDQEGDRNGNTTLEDALRNKVFVKYWQDAGTKDKLVKLSEQAYTDTDGNVMYGITGAINAYYNLLEDAVNPSAFNPTQSLTREQFYTLVFKSEEGVKEIKVDKDFESAVGGPTEYNRFAQEVDEYGFLSVANKSLDETSYKGSISRAEAIYMIVNKHFGEELAKVKDSDKAFKDTKNGGDIAKLLGFKYKDKETKEILEKDRWQMYTLATMLQNPTKGMQSELYKPLVVAKNLGLISGEELRWDEPISKAEAIQLIINTHLAKNELYGYLSTVEYGKMNLDKFSVATEEPEVLGQYEDGRNYGDGWEEVPLWQVPADPNKELSSGMTLWEAKELIEGNRKHLEGLGFSEEDIKISEEGLYRDTGTTAEEIARCPERPAPQVTPTPVEKPKAPSNNNNSGNKGSENNGGQLGVPGTFPKTNLDKDGDGIEDAFQQNGDINWDAAEGTTTPDPDFYLGTDIPE